MNTSSQAKSSSAADYAHYAVHNTDYPSASVDERAWVYLMTVITVIRAPQWSTVYVGLMS